MTEKDMRWNKFIETVCYRDLNTLSEIQRKAVLCFWYDAEMNSGGYSGYMDCYPDTNIEELTEAILSIGYKEIADNYRKAVTDGKMMVGLKQTMPIIDLLHHYVTACKTMLKIIKMLFLIEIIFKYKCVMEWEHKVLIYNRKLICSLIKGDKDG